MKPLFEQIPYLLRKYVQEHPELADMSDAEIAPLREQFYINNGWTLNEYKSEALLRANPDEEFEAYVMKLLSEGVSEEDMLQALQEMKDNNEL